MNIRQSFVNNAKNYFSFLTNDYNFTFIAPKSNSSLDPIRFEKSPIYIEIGWYKGEIDIIIGISSKTAILQPYKSRIFYLPEIALHLDSKALQRAPRFPNYITKEKEMIADLAYESELMKKYCSEILNGDIKILEEIALKRS
jgi:hypothetical protein